MWLPLLCLSYTGSTDFLKQQYVKFVHILQISRADLNQNFDMIVLVMYQCLEPVLFDLIHLYLLRYHRFRF